MIHVLRWDSTPGIRHPKVGEVIRRRDTHGDVAASIGELECIADEILEDLKEPGAIGPDLGRIDSEVEAKVDACCRRE